MHDVKKFKGDRLKDILTFNIAFALTPLSLFAKRRRMTKQIKHVLDKVQNRF